MVVEFPSSQTRLTRAQHAALASLLARWDILVQPEPALHRRRGGAAPIRASPAYHRRLHSDRAGERSVARGRVLAPAPGVARPPRAPTLPLHTARPPHARHLHHTP